MDKGPFSTVNIRIIDDTKGEMGRGKARNEGITTSDADWLFFLDADDRMHPKAFATMGNYTDLEAVWGNIWELSNGVGVWRYQVPEIWNYKELIAFDPYITLQMGHFVRRESVLLFDEDMKCGEDWKYYLEMWKTRHCRKVQECLFLNQRGQHSTGPKSATGAEWTAVVAELIANARGEGMNRSSCGPGSTKEKTKAFRKFLKEIIDKYGVKKVNDAGCGDLFWITIDDFNIDYVGYDDLIRKDALDRAKEGWELHQCNLLTNPMRECDLVICKDVFRHHNEKGIKSILFNIKASAKYLIADYDSEHIVATDTWHKPLQDGEYYAINANSVDLRRYLGEPIESTDSNEREEKRYGLWKL